MSRLIVLFLMQWLSLLTTIVIIVASGSSVMMDSAGQMDLGSLDGGKHCSQYVNNDYVFTLLAHNRRGYLGCQKEKKY